MRFNYSVLHPGQDALYSLPRLPVSLRSGTQIIETVGLVDSGAMLNVLPFTVGQQLGFVWEDANASIGLAGAFSGVKAIPVTAIASIADFPPVRLAFAWASSDKTPMIFGQINFFQEFEICFFKKEMAFELNLQK
ncbi:MAG: hypothetical protein ACKVUS_01975 [Saprospiraceae bacterium]